MLFTSRRSLLLFTTTESTGISRAPWSRLSSLAVKAPSADLLILKTSRSLALPTSRVPFQFPVTLSGDAPPSTVPIDIRSEVTSSKHNFFILEVSVFGLFGGSGRISRGKFLHD